MMWFLAVLISSLVFWTWTGQRTEQPDAPPPACTISADTPPAAPLPWAAELPNDRDD